MFVPYWFKLTPLSAVAMTSGDELCKKNMCEILVKSIWFYKSRYVLIWRGTLSQDLYDVKQERNVVNPFYYSSHCVHFFHREKFVMM